MYKGILDIYKKISPHIRGLYVVSCIVMCRYIASRHNPFISMLYCLQVLSTPLYTNIMMEKSAK